MDLDDRDLAAFGIDILVEGDQPGLMRLEETRQPRDAPLLEVESAVPEPVGGNEDERLSGISSALGGLERAGAAAEPFQGAADICRGHDPGQVAVGEHQRPAL
jgi:hypothetical protein